MVLFNSLIFFFKLNFYLLIEVFIFWACSPGVATASTVNIDDLTQHCQIIFTQIYNFGTISDICKSCMHSWTYFLVFFRRCAAWRKFVSRHFRFALIKRTKSWQGCTAWPLTLALSLSPSLKWQPQGAAWDAAAMWVRVDRVQCLQLKPHAAYTRYTRAI